MLTDASVIAIPAPVPIAFLGKKKLGKKILGNKKLMETKIDRK